MSTVHELKALRRANTRLTEQAQLAAEARRTAAVITRADRAYVDALDLVTLHIVGGDVGRARAGLPQRRWAYAVALLRLAGLAHGRFVRVTLQPTTEATVAALQWAHGVAIAQPWRWAAYMPAYARSALLTGDAVQPSERSQT